MNSQRTINFCQVGYWLWDSLNVTAVPGEFFVSLPLYALLEFESLALSLRSLLSCPSNKSGKNYSTYITTCYMT